MPGYNYLKNDSKKSTKAKRGSGGVLVFFKSQLQRGLTKIASRAKDAMWIKLDKTVFGLPQHTYIACVYIAPEGSTAHKECDPFIIKEEIAYFSSLGEMILLGDFNSRIADKQETLVYYNDFKGEHNNYVDDEIEIIIERNSQDVKKNNF